MKILITGNGTFLEHQPYLLETEIQKRFDINFEKYFNHVFGERPYGKLINRVSSANIITFGDGFFEIIDRFHSNFTSKIWEKNYEEKVGETINDLMRFTLMKEKNYGKEKSSFLFKEVYLCILNVIQAIVFECAPVQPSHMKVYQPSVRYDRYFTFNLLFTAISNSSEVKFLHGQLNLKRWSIGKEVDRQLMQAAGLPDEEDRVLFAENIFDQSHLSYMINNFVPVLFGMGIKQKISILKMLKGWNETQNEKIIDAFKRNIPYLELKDLSDGADVDIIGVRPKAHEDLLDYIGKANSINWYYYTEQDRQEILKIKEKYPNVHLTEYK